MVSQGYFEVSTLAFYSDADLDALHIDRRCERTNVIRLLNPITTKPFHHAHNTGSVHVEYGVRCEEARSRTILRVRECILSEGTSAHRTPERDPACWIRGIR